MDGLSIYDKPIEGLSSRLPLLSASPHTRSSRRPTVRSGGSTDHSHLNELPIDSAGPSSMNRPTSTHPFHIEHRVPHYRRRKAGMLQSASSLSHHQPDMNSKIQQHSDVKIITYSSGHDRRDDCRQLAWDSMTTSRTGSSSNSASMPEDYENGVSVVNDKLEQISPLRARTNAGRAEMYSSAASSLESNVYSYQLTNEHVFHPHPPPIPVASFDINLMPSPDAYARTNVINASEMCYPAMLPAPYAQRTWRSDSINSTATSITTLSMSTADTASSSYQMSSVLAHASSSLSFPDSQQMAENKQTVESSKTKTAVLVDEMQDGGVFDSQTLESMGGLSKLTESSIRGLSDITQMLLPYIGSGILNILPSVLNVLSSTLVVLDISNNDLSGLSSALQDCTSLEELNVSGNPIGLLPSSLGRLSNLHVLIADSCGLRSLPVELYHLQNLHTISIQGNQFVSLPPRLCTLSHLEVLRVDNNPFTTQWATIVRPILSPTLSQSDGARASTLGHIELGLSHRSRPISTMSASKLPLSESVVELEPLNHGKDNFQSASPMNSRTLGYHASQTDLQKPLRTLLNMRSAGALLGQGSAAPAPNDISTPPPDLNMNGRFESHDAIEGSRYVTTLLNESAEGKIESVTSRPSETMPKNGKWGFLRKISISRIRSENKNQAQLSSSASANIKLMPPPIERFYSTPSEQNVTRPILSPSARSAETLPICRTGDFDVSEFGLALNASPVAATLPEFFQDSTGTSRGNYGSFLPVDSSPPSIDVSIPSMSQSMVLEPEELSNVSKDHSFEDSLCDIRGQLANERGSRSGHNMTTTLQSAKEGAASGLESIMLYLRDLYDLSRPTIQKNSDSGVFESSVSSLATSDRACTTGAEQDTSESVSSDIREARLPNPDGKMSQLQPKSNLFCEGDVNREMMAENLKTEDDSSGKRFKNDNAKRERVIREIFETEKTYVRGLDELVSIYVQPASLPIYGVKSHETVVPVAERKIVFGGIESILAIHRDNFLPALDRSVRRLLDDGDDTEGSLSMTTAHAVGQVFRTYIAYMKQYSTYINNFDNALSRMKMWTSGTPISHTGLMSTYPDIGNVSTTTIGSTVISTPVTHVGDSVSLPGYCLTPSQKKRVKGFLKRCREHPKHSQIDLVSYLLLPVQRVPRYKLLLEDLVMCTPSCDFGQQDALDDALNEISNLASLMNEEKREAESRLRLLHWQNRITSRGPSPLVQPHRRLITDGTLTLIRLVKKASTFVEVESPVFAEIDSEQTIASSKAVVPVDYLQPEIMEQPITLILCSDLLVLVRQCSGEGRDGLVDLFAVSRMAALCEPASVTQGGHILRVVDNKTIYYFEGGSPGSAQKWCRAINEQCGR